MFSYFIQNLQKNILENYRKEEEDFIFECIVELGYEGQIDDLKKIKKFIKENHIEEEICYEYEPGYNLIRIKCPSKNYIKEKLIGFMRRK